MLGQAALCACFGFAYIGILNLPPLTAGLALPLLFLPLPIWGVLWFICAFTLTVAAFKVDQAKALGGVASLLVIWSISYLYFWLTTPVLPSGYTNAAFLSSAMLGSMVLNAIGCSRMLNHAPSHAEVIEAPGAPDAH
ncbi:hypothetical protein [uncultured Arthrobacter sp.]|uniref:hypothetical protein n=1 Tax=uncultured Arthrobacter sp. TaxID=114050 RepID=UPI003217D8A6